MCGNLLLRMSASRTGREIKMPFCTPLSPPPRNPRELSPRSCVGLWLSCVCRLNRGSISRYQVVVHYPRWGSFSCNDQFEVALMDTDRVNCNEYYDFRSEFVWANSLRTKWQLGMVTVLFWTDHLCHNTTRVVFDYIRLHFVGEQRELQYIHWVAIDFFK